MSHFATKSDLTMQSTELRAEMKLMEIRIIDTVSEVIGDAMQNISHAYERHEAMLQRLDATVNRIEAKLGTTADRVDDHEGRLRYLEKLKR